MDGTRITGPVEGIQIEDVCVYRATGNGITGTVDPFYTGGQQAPYNLRAFRLRVHYCTGEGVSVASVTDSTWIDVHAIGCASAWKIAAGANSRYIYPTEHDNLSTPDTGIIIESQPVYVGLSNVFINAGVTPIRWDKTGLLSTRGVATRIGSGEAASEVALETDIGSAHD